MGVAVKNFDMGRGRHTYVRTILKLMVQAVLLFGLDKWVLNPYIGKALEVFLHRLTLQLVVKQPYRKTDEIWEYPLPPPWGGG